MYNIQRCALGLYNRKPFQWAYSITVLTVKGYARLPVQAAGQRVDADAVVVMALRRGHDSMGLSSRDLCGSIFVFDVPKGCSPELRDGP